MGRIQLPIQSHRLMSRAGLSLGGVLASKNRLRFTRQDKDIPIPLNDVLAHNSLNDVMAFENSELDQMHNPRAATL